jgi:two-component system sensor histidine kinase ChvG
MTRAGALTQFSRSIRVQAIALILVFVIPPILLYSVFRSAERDKETLLLDAVRENGDLVGKAMEPILKRLQPGDFAAIQDELARFGAGARAIKVLFSPAHSTSFFYVASSPPVPFKDLEQERQRLQDLGILDRLSGSCSGNLPLGERVTLPNGTGEVLTSVTPVQSERGCWAVVVAASTDSVTRLIDGRPYWTRPEARMAIAVYATMAVLVLLIFAAVWSALAGFRRTAARVEQGQSFATSTGVPELAQVGREFDGMVARLKRATDVMRQAAEDNAHAFKGPIAVIRQAIELVGKRVENSGEATMGVTAIAASCDRLEGLVRSAQRLDTATADLLETGWSKVDLSALVKAFAEDYRLMLGLRQDMLKMDVEPGVLVRGRDDILETILENLVDNAISFSPPDGTVEVKLRTKDGMAILSIEDRGPGVEPPRLPRIFERYYSSRPTPEDATAPAEMHFGIGLWLVRQHALALGGSAQAENRKPNGLSVAILIPLA